MTKPRLSLSDDELRRLYVDERLTMQEIGDRYGVTRQRVQQRLGEMGVAGILRHDSIDETTLRTLYQNHRLSIPEIAAKLKTSSNQVQRELTRHGIRRPHLTDFFVEKYTREDIERVYITEGLDQIDSAKKLGMGLKRFKEILRIYGITHRHRGIPFTRKPKK